MIDHQKLARDLVDKGMLIEAGWLGLRVAAIPDNAPQIQLDEMRQAFFAGAAHLFSTIMQILEPGEEATEADLLRFDQISDELKAFIAAFERRNLKTEGNA